jgi:XTP/dITP diphosphohydrolase
MDKQITFITGNQDKWSIAKEVLAQYNIEVLQEAFETPEIQAFDVEEVAKYSAKYAADFLNRPVIVTDAGYFIEALNGFPAPYIKYVNKWLSSQNIVDMMKNEKNKKVLMRETVAYCKPNNEPIVFTSETCGQIVTEPQGSGSTIDQIVKRDGQEKVQGLIPHEEMIQFWIQNLSHFHDLGKYLQESS